MHPILIPTFTQEQFEAALECAVCFLREGKLVALPTETVYGLAANALNSEAVKSIYVAKGRPSNNPIIVHVSSIEMAKSCTCHWTPEAQTLARAFWPGPLSMILPRADCIGDAVTAGGETVAIRWPAHPVFQGVIRACGFPLAAPSANRSNHVSPTTAEHVLKSLGDNVPLILDGGPCKVGIESTVVDLSDPSFPRVLRPGMISQEAILAALGKGEGGKGTAPESVSQGPLKSPGQLRKHYSPKKPLSLVHFESEAELLGWVHEKDLEPAHCALLLTDLEVKTPFALKWNLSADPFVYASRIYAALYCSDEESQVSHIIVQVPPGLPLWRGIMDRLGRAACQ